MNDNVLKYKDYVGSVEYSAADERFFGKIIGLPDLATFEGDSAASLKKAFAEAADDYLAVCQETGKSLQRTYEGPFNVRISPELHRETAAANTKRKERLQHENH